MADLLDQFTRETIEISCSAGNVKACGWRFREFHLRDTLENWRITHVPSGLAFPYTFATVEDAAAAAIAFDRLQFCWSNLEPSDLPGLRGDVREIAEENRGKPRPKGLAVDCFRSELNGFAPTPEPAGVSV